MIREEDKVHKPVYYASNSLVGPELNYLPLEKLVFALVVASRKLIHYFDAHLVKVLTADPIRTALRKVDLASRMEKWSVELNIFHIKYEPRAAIKGQVLAYIIAEFSDDTVVAAASPAPPTGGQGTTSTSEEPGMSKA